MEPERTRGLACPSCQHENPPGARFCNACGAGIVRICAGCKNGNPPEARFCNACGRALDAETGAAERERAEAPRAPDPRSYTPRHLAEKILASKSALEGERKHVTVLFADVAGYTELAERADPEAMHALMDRCFQQILEQVHGYEGTVNQFTGDGVMALFGAPVSLEDAPRRALSAALGIQRALEPLDREVRERYGRAFRMRIGIHTGPVVVGRIGDDLRMDYTAVGDTTNLAARLQGLARPGSALISAATRRLVAGYFDLREVGPLDVKGKSQPVHAFEVEGERPVRGRIDALAEAGLTPFVGRERELDTLRAAFDAAREGRGQVVFVVGEAGMGKSRLLHELRSRLREEPHQWLEGRCTSYGRDTAFQPIIDALRRRFRIEDRDDDATALAKIERAERASGGELAWTLPFVRHLLSLPPGDDRVATLDPVMRRSETVRALHERLLRATERSPVVLVIEDLHWIDPTSEEFLAFLAESLPVTRALLVTTYRPGYTHPFGDRSYHVRIALQALSGTEMERVAGSLCETTALPRPLRELIARKAEGNPFFVEEVTKSLLEQGAVRRVDGRVELARDPSEISIPDSIQDVLMARIDRLAEEPKRAIQVASVIGREFALRLLAQISEAGNRIDTAVRELRALELIYQKAAHPELAFMFKHALTHEVAYESMLVQRRKALHALAGFAIEELYRDRLAEHYEALAHHFTLAEELERALVYHERAAEKAARSYANHAAAEHLRRALRLADRLGPRVPGEPRRRLEQRLAEACLTLSRFEESGDAYARAAQHAPDAVERGRDLANASWSYIWGHHFDRAQELAEQAISLGRREDAPVPQVFAILTRNLYETTNHGMGPRAIEQAEEALRLAERANDAESVVRSLAQLALWCEMCGRYRRSIAHGERALAAARSSHAHERAHVQWSLGLAQTCVGQYGPAIASLQTALEVCERIGDRALRARLLNTLGWCHAELGAHERAADYNQRAAALGREMVELELVAGAPELHANGAINLAGNRIALGDLDGALEQLEPIQAELGRPGDAWQRWRYGMHLEDALARVALARGDPEAALRWIEREVEHARRYMAPKIEARALELRARALVGMDLRAEAETALEQAAAIAQRIEYPPVLWRAASLRSELARRAGLRDQAERYAAAARDTTERLAAGIEEPALAGELRALGARLAADPLAAYR